MRRISTAVCLCVCLCMATPWLVADSEPKNETALKKRVLIIGIDGCRPDAIAAAKEAVHLHALVREGAFSEQADVIGDRKVGADTSTGPGWSSILAGVWADKHRVVNNAFQKHKLREYPTFFRRLKEVRPAAATVALVSWKPFEDHVFSLGEGCRMIQDGDKHGYLDADKRVAEAAVKVLKEESPDALFVYFGEVDITGHGYGFHPKSPKYTRALEGVDLHLGQILDTLRKRPAYAKEDWLIVVCTDHGGRGREHGLGQDVPEIRNGLLILHGRSVQPGKLEGRIENVDVAFTCLTHLGVTIAPEWKLDGKVVGLRK